MLNHRDSRAEISGSRTWKLPAGVHVALGLAVALSASAARAQECQSDADCGFGFRCHQEVISTTTSGGTSVSTAVTTTVGTTGAPAEPVCGDSICAEEENPEACPEDCGIVSYCVGASCESNSDCAEDYACQPAGGVYSTTTTGSDGPLCGDRECEAPESEETCSTDCSTERTCQVAQCETDADCDEGFYCDPRGGSAVASVSGSSGGSGGSGSSGTIELYQSGCLPLPTDGAGGNGSAVSGSAVSGSDGSAESISAVSTATTGGVTSGIGGNGNGNGNGSGNGHSSGGHQPPWPHHPGCAVAGALSSGSPLVAALAGLFACGFVQRRRRRD